MALKLEPKGPMLLGLLGIGAIWLLSRRAATVTAQQNAIVNGQQTYSTATSVAAVLGAAIAAYTKGATPTVRQDNILNFDWKATPAEEAKAAASWSALAPELGVFSFMGGSLFPPNWSAPTESLVVRRDLFGRAIDGAPSGAVYDVGTDFVNNPFALAAP